MKTLFSVIKSVSRLCYGTDVRLESRKAFSEALWLQVEKKDLSPSGADYWAFFVMLEVQVGSGKGSPSDTEYSSLSFLCDMTTGIFIKRSQISLSLSLSFASLFFLLTSSIFSSIVYVLEFKGELLMRGRESLELRDPGKEIATYNEMRLRP